MGTIMNQSFFSFLYIGIHAREWISPAQALWTIHAVIADERMLDNLDWFIHPVVNPDGFTFTHEHVSYAKSCTIFLKFLLYLDKALEEDQI